MHACQDALLTVYNGHIVAKACLELNIQHPDEMPPSSTLINLKDLATKIVDEFTIIPEALLGKPLAESSDSVYNYARVLCHYAALVTEFLDGWSEGDGIRVLRCWRVFLLHFYTNRRTKYACETLRLKFQLASLPPHLISQLTWDRFINTHGGNGHNIPCDLHNEHINCLFKEIVGNLGPNLQKKPAQEQLKQ